MLLIALLACTDGKGEEIVGDPVAGETIYSTTCAACHGADGTGSETYPDLTEEVPDLQDSEIQEVVLGGDGAMPAYDLDEQEMADLLAYLRATFG